MGWLLLRRPRRGRKEEGNPARHRPGPGKAQWARLDASPAPKTLRKWGDVFDRYEKEIIPGKAPRTQKDNLLSLTQLRKAFSEAPVEALTPQVLAQYRDKRSAKVRANRELSLFSHIFNIAREWGIVTAENPVKGFARTARRRATSTPGPRSGTRYTARRHRNSAMPWTLHISPLSGRATC